MITHHPDTELLLDYATGALTEPMALSVACHASLCKACASELKRLEALGGTLLEQSDKAQMDATSLNAVLNRLDDPEPEPLRPSAQFDAESLRVLPMPLRDYLPASLEALNWRHIGSKVSQYNLDLHVGNYKISLMRFKAGSAQPIHTHKGQEITLVLTGGYTDQGHHFEVGDFDLKDTRHKHQPVVDSGEDCYALVVMDAPVVLAGPFSRFLNPFIKL
ncbi:MAG: anti-sigma factor [Alphaproteobacteria bacterium]|nr:MAG: anti-sigma factor [Alphaproteobacteria bacterium]